MADTVIASGFGQDWDGKYIRKKLPSEWVHSSGNYWIFRDSWNFYLSASPNQFGEPRVKAVMSLKEDNRTLIIDPTGNYDGVDGNPNGVVL